MRFILRITRVQQAERVIQATDEDAALAKAQEQLQRPYGLIGMWKDVDTNIEVVDSEPVAGVSRSRVGEGPLLLSVAEASKHMGVSQGSLRELINRGEIEHVRIGRRILLSREGVNRFIVANSRTDYTYGP